jgi:hypothetical protein
MNQIDKMTLGELVKYVRDNKDKSLDAMVEELLNKPTEDKIDKVKLWAGEQGKPFWCIEDNRYCKREIHHTPFGDGLEPDFNLYQTKEECQEDVDYFKALQEWRRLARAVNKNGKFNYGIFIVESAFDSAKEISFISIQNTSWQSRQKISVYFESKEAAILAYNSLSDFAKGVLFDNLPLKS